MCRVQVNYSHRELGRKSTAAMVTEKTLYILFKVLKWLQLAWRYTIRWMQDLSRMQGQHIGNLYFLFFIFLKSNLVQPEGINMFKTFLPFSFLYKYKHKYWATSQPSRFLYVKVNTRETARTGMETTAFNRLPDGCSQWWNAGSNHTRSGADTNINPCSPALRVKGACWSLYQLSLGEGR